MTGGSRRLRISVQQKVRPAPLKGSVLRALLRRGLGFAGVVEADIRVLVVGAGEMARWNRDFLGRPEAATVLSFPEEPAGSGRTGLAAGDIVLCASACLSKTTDWPGTAEERVFFFLLHGALHLLGYDHEKGRSEALRMRREEVRIYRSCLKERGSSV